MDVYNSRDPNQTLEEYKAVQAEKKRDLIIEEKKKYDIFSLHK